MYVFVDGIDRGFVNNILSDQHAKTNAYRETEYIERRKHLVPCKLSESNP
jgi:hypothetical protein